MKSQIVKIISVSKIIPGENNMHYITVHGGEAECVTTSIQRCVSSWSYEGMYESDSPFIS